MKYKRNYKKTGLIILVTSALKKMNNTPVKSSTLFFVDITQIERFSLTACPVHEVSGTNKL